jgi:hypothetical protein
VTPGAPHALGSGGTLRGVPAGLRSSPRRLVALSLALCALLARSATAGGAPTPPGPPESGPGSPQTAFPAASEDVIDNPVDPKRKIHVFRPKGDRLPERLPVALFAHGFGAPNADPYRTWLDRMARQGVLVVFPVYPGLEPQEKPTRYDVLYAGFEAGLAWLDGQPGPKPDRTRAGFVGHSFGGGAVGAVAARAAARGIGSKAMWIEAWAPWYDLDKEAWASIPSHAVLLEGVFADDKTCDRATAADQYARATTIPADRKAYVLFRTDAHGSPKLEAGHLAPLTRLRRDVVDALDTRGTWRLDDALRTFALTGSQDAAAIAFGRGNDPAPLGTWSDGVPVTPPVFGVPEKVEADARVFWPAGGPREAFGRNLGRAEPLCTLPLPPPEIAPASKLPYAERVERAVPDAWPAAISAAAKDGPLLVLVAAADPSETALMVAKAAETLKTRGVRFLSLAPEDPLAVALAPAELPSVLLLGKGGGSPRLWREGEEPHLAAALLDLTK